MHTYTIKDAMKPMTPRKSSQRQTELFEELRWIQETFLNELNDQYFKTEDQQMKDEIQLRR